MSFAIIETGGKQYKVSASKILEIEKLNAKVGQTIKFNNVLLLNDDKSTEIGNPKVEGAPSTLGFPISVLLSSFKSKTLLNLIVWPTLAFSFSISNILLADTLYCFPPVSIIANDIKSLFLNFNAI